MTMAMMTVRSPARGERDERDGEQDGGDRHEPVHHAHDDAVEPAEVAGEERRCTSPTAALMQRHRDADDQRDARAVERRGCRRRGRGCRCPSSACAGVWVPSAFRIDRSRCPASGCERRGRSGPGSMVPRQRGQHADEHDHGEHGAADEHALVPRGEARPTPRARRGLARRGPRWGARSATAFNTGSSGRARCRSGPRAG